MQHQHDRAGARPALGVRPRPPDRPAYATTVRTAAGGVKRPRWWPAGRDDDGPRRAPDALTDEQRAALELAQRALLASATVEAATHLGYASQAASASAHEEAESAVTAALDAGVSRAVLESAAADATAAVHGT